MENNLYASQDALYYVLFALVLVAGLSLSLVFSGSKLLSKVEDVEGSVITQLTTLCFLLFSTSFVFLTIAIGDAQTSHEHYGLITRKFGFLILVVGLVYLVCIGKLYGAKNTAVARERTAGEATMRNQAYIASLDQYNQKIGSGL